MSVTVSDILKLPSLYGAAVVAGVEGLSNPVESVTVLEYGEITPLLDDLFSNTQFEGNELIISSFASIREDVPAQCENVRRYHAKGASGMVLFYVGLIMPSIDPALVDCCNELGFVLIKMPQENVLMHKYSDVIGDISNALFKDKQSGTEFVSALMSRFSKLEKRQQSIASLLRMLSNHLQASVILASHTNSITHIAAWPQTIAPMLEETAEKWLAQLGTGSCLAVDINRMQAYLQYCPPLIAGEDSFKLYILNHDETLSRDVLFQASDLIQLYSHIYNRNLGKHVASELVKAIVDNDPLKMKRLSATFHIDVESLNHMWLFLPKNRSDSRDMAFLSKCAEFLAPYSSPVLAGRHEGNLVVFSGAPSSRSEREEIAREFLASPDVKNGEYCIISCDCLRTTEDVHRVYFDALRHVGLAQIIYPRAERYGYSHIAVAKACAQAAESGSSLDYYLSLLNKIREKPELLSTLTAYLLDEGSNLARTAQALCCHINTVKYRLRAVRDIYGFSVSDMPDVLPLYIAVALNRMMESRGGSPDGGF